MQALVPHPGRWMPPRWRGKSKSKHDAAAARRSDSLLTPAADGTLVLVNALSPFAPFRTRAEQEAEAASMGATEPRLRSGALVLQAHAPRWRVPRCWRVLRATDEKVCSICLDEFKPRDVCRSLPCGHTFHSTCIEHWLELCSDCCPDDSRPVVAPHAASTFKEVKV
ncbi:hypothetical protein EMIHUDRAFT_453966 [Emiliania huxleyi CCMP1516]|uniref:RING-type E3 ubiquitin transferase n=2 Tax=Emiliania huxleyi TaxID=2903 RepID=A0A0D3HYJ1_EMIH1|nr:hypothetical protein EMIHUDRAFT_453966 [Emiliania huxleyi CCMP1516]EOD04076.1 hypothetical protein EMIHUDRAFT_453966 [Emiliania huxleyi CCMP1516]|eukprot:XP_005756505.1 hypothetical protein EMIHUDRAFT_453966 [Emiliania huxleyi CCMP1516]